jgi:hypothetical protein
MTSPCSSPAGTPQSTTEREEVRPLNYLLVFLLGLSDGPVLYRCAEYASQRTPEGNVTVYLNGSQGTVQHSTCAVTSSMA